MEQSGGNRAGVGTVHLNSNSVVLFTCQSDILFVS
jgi:hypothetical protein